MDKFLMRCAGFSLLEVLITLLVISVGFLAFSRLYLLNLKSSQQAYLHRIALNQLSNMNERLRANSSREGVSHLSRELAKWLAVTKTVLPKANGQVQVASPAHYKITVSWQSETNVREMISSDVELKHLA